MWSMCADFVVSGGADRARSFWSGVGIMAAEIVLSSFHLHNEKAPALVAKTITRFNSKLGINRPSYAQSTMGRL